MRANRSARRKTYQDILESDSSDQKARAAALAELSKFHMLSGDCYLVLGAKTVMPSTFIGRELCYVILFLSEGVTGVDFLEGIPSEEEFRNRTIELLVDGDPENIKLYEKAMRGLKSLMRRLYQVEDFIWSAE